MIRKPLLVYGWKLQEDESDRPPLPSHFHCIHDGSSVYCIALEVEINVANNDIIRLNKVNQIIASMTLDQTTKKADMQLLESMVKTHGGVAEWMILLTDYTDITSSCGSVNNYTQERKSKSSSSSSSKHSSKSSSSKNSSSRSSSDAGSTSTDDSDDTTTTTTDSDDDDSTASEDESDDGNLF